MTHRKHTKRTHGRCPKCGNGWCCVRAQIVPVDGEACDPGKRLINSRDTAVRRRGGKDARHGQGNVVVAG